MLVNCSHEIVRVLFAAGFARVREEFLNGFVADVEELDEDEDAIVGDVGGFAELFDLAFRERRVGTLSVKGKDEREENEGEREPAQHGFPVS